MVERRPALADAAPAPAATLAGMTTNPAVTSPATQPAAIVVPAPGTYRIDVARSAITFTTRHLFGLGPVRGDFDLREGEIRVTDPLPESSARAKISAASFRTGNPSRDGAVRSARLLDAGAYPDITFISRRLDQADGRWVLHGLLSVRGNAHPVELLIEEAQPGRAGPAPAGQRPPRPLRLRDHQGQGPGRPAPRPGARHRRPPALSRAVIGRQEAAHGGHRS